jgi:1,2-diacylglycerol 3-alpha-glucosyltransferase
MKPRVAILFDNLGPYHIARLSAAAKTLDLLVIEQRATSLEYAWAPTDQTSFERVTLLKADVPTDPKLERSKLHDTLDAFRPDVIAVPGWSSRQAIECLIWSLGSQVPVIVMSESQEVDFPRRFWQESIKARIIQSFAAGLVGGAPHREYLVKLGMKPNKTYTGYDVVDNKYFKTAADKARSSQRATIEKTGLHNPFFLCSARFVEKKNLFRLIDAFSRYRASEKNQDRAGAAYDLVLLGDGPLRSSIELAVQKKGVADAVHMPGFVQYDSLPNYYGLASIFVLPSTSEQWGLVVNEAMAAGLPVLVSERCGCAPDLVENGKNGFTFDPYDVDALSDFMLRMAGPDCDRAAMGAASLEKIDRWSPAAFASGLEHAVQAALQGGGRKPDWLYRLILRILALR